jgi:hypothetical protein
MRRDLLGRTGAWALLALLLLATFGMAACSTSDDDSTGPSPNLPAAGYWEGITGQGYGIGFYLDPEGTVDNLRLVVQIVGSVCVDTYEILPAVTTTIDENTFVVNFYVQNIDGTVAGTFTDRTHVEGTLGVTDSYCDGHVDLNWTGLWVHARPLPGE